MDCNLQVPLSGPPSTISWFPCGRIFFESNYHMFLSLTAIIIIPCLTLSLSIRHHPISHLTPLCFQWQPLPYALKEGSQVFHDAFPKHHSMVRKNQAFVPAIWIPHVASMILLQTLICSTLKPHTLLRETSDSINYLGILSQENDPL